MKSTFRHNTRHTLTGTISVACSIFLIPQVHAALFAEIPGLSQAAKDALAVHFDGRSGVSVNGLGGVTGWAGRDGNGNTVVTAQRQGNNGFNVAADVQDNSNENANISYNATTGTLVFTENAVYETAHLYVPLVDGSGNNLLVGGASTIFWLGSYSGANPQGNGTLGRYAYNITSVDLNVIGGGFNHQRRNADENVGAFVTNNTGGSSQTRLGSSISTYNDTPTVWTSVYDFDSATRTMDFFATDGDGIRTDLGIANPTSAVGTHSFADDTALPNLYIGSISYPFFYDPHNQPSSGTNGGFTFIGEMQQLIIFEGILSGDDIAAVEAWLVAVPEPGAAMLAMLGALGLLRRRR